MALCKFVIELNWM